MCDRIGARYRRRRMARAQKRANGGRSSRGLIAAVAMFSVAAACAVTGAEATFHVSSELGADLPASMGTRAGSTRARGDHGRPRRRPRGAPRRRLRHDETGGGFRATPRTSGDARALRRSRHPPRRRPGGSAGPPRHPHRFLLRGGSRDDRRAHVPSPRSGLRPHRLRQRHARLLLRPLQRHRDQRGVPRPRRLPGGVRLDPRILLPQRQARRVRRGRLERAAGRLRRRSSRRGLRGRVFRRRGRRRSPL